MCKLEDYDKLHLDKAHRNNLIEELSLWHEHYLPPSGLEGKTVLDLGAGCGETAFFFLVHGASRVVCIESDQNAVRLLRENFSSDNRVDIVHAQIDAIKIDIEGSELGAIVETHFPTRFRKVRTINRDLDVNLWRIEKKRVSFSLMKRSLQRALHRSRIAVAHRIRLTIDKLADRQRKRCG